MNIESNCERMKLTWLTSHPHAPPTPRPLISTANPGAAGTPHWASGSPPWTSPGAPGAPGSEPRVPPLVVALKLLTLRQKSSSSEEGGASPHGPTNPMLPAFFRLRRWHFGRVGPKVDPGLWLAVRVCRAESVATSQCPSPPPPPLFQQVAPHWPLSSETGVHMMAPRVHMTGLQQDDTQALTCCL